MSQVPHTHHVTSSSLFLPVTSPQPSVMETKPGLAPDGRFECLPSILPTTPGIPLLGTHCGIFRTGGNLKVIERIPLDVQDIPSVSTDLGVVRVQLSSL